MPARIVLLFIASILLASCSKDLTRSEAQALLEPSEFFKATRTADVKVGRFCDSGTTGGGEEIVRTKNQLVHLGAPKGLAEYHVSEVRDDQPIPEECERVVPMVPNAAGKMVPFLALHAAFLWDSVVTAKGASAGLPKDGGSYSYAKRELANVSGLAKNGDGSVDVEFTWRWKLTPSAAAAGFTPDELEVSTDPMPGRANAKRYDDGWRLAVIP